ncbi:putative RNA-dependent RNA polymerase [Freshwater macrophyte associated sobeli-like virus 1]|nr:putative RNA-dependent RNA polymerase [Freshwater macrophyte associated sobeli-like virus 1]
MNFNLRFDLATALAAANIFVLLYQFKSLYDINPGFQRFCAITSAAFVANVIGYATFVGTTASLAIDKASAAASHVSLPLILALLCLGLASTIIWYVAYPLVIFTIECAQMYRATATAVSVDAVLLKEAKIIDNINRSKLVKSKNTLPFYDKDGRTVVGCAVTAVFQNMSVVVMPHHVAKVLFKTVTAGIKVNGKLHAELHSSLSSLPVFFCSPELDVIALSIPDVVRDRIQSFFGVKFQPLARKPTGKLSLWSLSTAIQDGYNPMSAALGETPLDFLGAGRVSTSFLEDGFMSPWHRLHKATSLPGDSGSPMYTTNGEIAAMHLGACEQANVATSNYCVLLYPMFASVLRRLSMSLTKLPTPPPDSLKLITESSLDYEDDERGFWTHGRADADIDWRDTKVRAQGLEFELKYTPHSAFMDDDQFKHEIAERWEQIAHSQLKVKEEGRQTFCEMFLTADDDDEYYDGDDFMDDRYVAVGESAQRTVPLTAKAVDEICDDETLQKFTGPAPPQPGQLAAVVYDANRLLLSKHCSENRDSRDVVIPIELADVPGIDGFVGAPSGPKEEHAAFRALAAVAVPALNYLYDSQDVVKFKKWFGAADFNVPLPKWMRVGPGDLRSPNPEFVEGVTSAYRDARATVKPDSSPGVPYAGIYNKQTNQEMFDEPGAELAIWTAVFNRLLALTSRKPVPRDKKRGLLEFRKLSDAEYAAAVNAEHCDVIRMFIKNEPHTLSKARDRRWRLIASVSIVDQIIQRILHGPLNNAEKLLSHKQSHCIGLGHGDDKIAVLASKFRAGVSPPSTTAVSSDVSNFDFSLYPDHFAVDQEYRRLVHRCEPGDWWTQVSASFEQLLLNARFIAGDGKIVVPRFGVQKSGSFCTSSSNSHIRAFISYVSGAESCMVIGDDAVEFYNYASGANFSAHNTGVGPLAPHAGISVSTNTTLGHGLRIKSDEVHDCTSGIGVEFMGARFDFESDRTTYISTRPGKAVYKALLHLKSLNATKQRLTYLQSWLANWEENYRFLSTSKCVDPSVRSQLAGVPAFLGSLADDESKLKQLSPPKKEPTTSPQPQPDDQQIENNKVGPALPEEAAPPPSGSATSDGTGVPVQVPEARLPPNPRPADPDESSLAGTLKTILEQVVKQNAALAQAANAASQAQSRGRSGRRGNQSRSSSKSARGSTTTAPTQVQAQPQRQAAGQPQQGAGKDRGTSVPRQVSETPCNGPRHGSNE